MKALIQRVTEASVEVAGNKTGSIDKGILVLLGVEKGDSEKEAEKLVNKVISYRIFPDSDNHMNLSLREINGDLLVVSQFTLVASTSKGLRPSFSSAATPEEAEKLYECFVEESKKHCQNVQTGMFGGDMKVSLINDGPVTFLLST